MILQKVFIFCLNIVGYIALEDAAYWSQVAHKELQEALDVQRNMGKAQNVIMFVGDGLGLNTLTAARLYTGQQKGQKDKAEAGNLVFERFPHLGLLKTYSVDKQVPDSACSATALFSGVKTNYEVSGHDATVKLGDCAKSLDSTTRVDSMIKWAQDVGKLTGFVTTTRVTHATPSALFAHTPDRRWECEDKMPSAAAKCKDIARQMVEDEPGKSIRVIMGGGRQCLTTNFTSTPGDPEDTWACRRRDNRDLIATWREHKVSINVSYAHVSNTKELQAIDTENTEFLLGIFANGHMRYDHERDTSENGMPSLAEMTRTAIQILDNAEKGFLLIVEGGLIDQAHHRGIARRALHETMAMDEAVKEAVELTNTADTLIIVTADHGHTLSLSGYPKRGADILGIAQPSLADGLNYTTLSYATGTAIKYKAVNSTHITRTDPSQEDLTSFKYEQHAAISHNEETHSGGDVAVYAIGPMAHLFHSLHEQNYVAYVVAYATKIGPFATGAASLASINIVILLSAIILVYTQEMYSKL